MRFTIQLFLIVVVFCATVSATTITSTFECKSTENDSATMTYYNYIEEPKLEKCSYSEGYKTGTLVYLENGDIDFRDYISYYDGLKDATHNEPYVNYSSALQREQKVDFEGDKAIAKIYAKGYFPNNRALSAWKKIRYTEMWYDVTKISDTDRYAYRVGEKYGPMNVEANTDIGMGPMNETGKPFDYYFDYNADVKNGALEVWDSTGWTNETCGKRVDWEQTALMKGNFTAVNKLVAEGVFIPAAGDDDWLSCCIGGNPPIVPSCPGGNGNCSIGLTAGYWPNSGVYYTLDPDIILPNSKMLPIQNLGRSDEYRRYSIDIAHIGLSSEYERYSNNLIRNIPNDRNYTECNTTDTECAEGYECIYTDLDEGYGYSSPGAGQGTGSSPAGQDGPGIEIFKRVDDFDKVNNTVNYMIRIHNVGNTDLVDVKVVDILPEYLKFNYSQVYNSDVDISINIDRLIDIYGDEGLVPDDVNDGVDNGWPSGGSDIQPKVYSRLTESGSTDTAFNLTWELGTLNSGENVYIYMDASIDDKGLGSTDDNKVVVEGIFAYGSERIIVTSQATITETE